MYHIDPRLIRTGAWSLTAWGAVALFTGALAAGSLPMLAAAATAGALSAHLSRGD